jgi:hypothetical protein
LSSSRGVAASDLAHGVVGHRGLLVEIVSNGAHFVSRARRGSSFAGDVSPASCVVRNEKGIFDRGPFSRSPDVMEKLRHVSIASFELHAPPRRRM